LLDASTTVVDQFGGDIAIQALNVVAPGDFDIHGGRDGTAGTLFIDTTQFAPLVGGDIAFTGKVDATSGESFSAGVELIADGDVNCQATIDLQATKEGGSGGLLDIDAGGSVTLGGTVRASGEASSEDIGDAGDVEVDAGGSIALTGIIDLSGPPGGSGGGASFTAALDITQTGSIDVGGRGQEGVGNEALFSAERTITLGNIAGLGGANGAGGFVDATAWCGLALPTGKTIDMRGPTGSIVLASGGAMTVAGTLRSTAGNELQFRTAAPVVTGTLTPPLPGPVQVPSLIPCGGLPPVGCGDDVKQPAEECDASAPSGDAACPGKCSTTCHCQGCGNGILDTGEECDDGNTASCDGCRADCTRRDDVCGDGIPECGEPADDGDNDSCDGVSADCRPERCGNGIRECAEECDEGAAGSATCTSACRAIAPTGCGNGTQANGEACDDGNTTDCDGCSHLCQFDGCGSGTIDPGCNEQCDDLNTRPGDGCSATCTLESCGNGVQDDGEECDAGARNGQPDAGCSTTCTRAFCGNGKVETGEECDTGAQIGQPGTPCSAECKRQWCGNGVVDPGELCDAGAQNGAPGSGCQRDVCRPGSLCTAPPEDGCIPCTDTSDCDPLRACGASACAAGVCSSVTPPTCDDGNACTVDACDPASGCTTTPVDCQDTTACDGTLSCDPATGQCANGPAPSCDDGDSCTDDACTETMAGATCGHQLRPGIDGAGCRLSALQGLIDSADLPKGTRKKLRKQAKGIARKLPKAAGTGRKAEKARRQIGNGLMALTRTVARAHRRIDPDTASDLNAAIMSATVAVGNL
jgi:cysteine-rich repeat protein